jgi:NADPH:quinone reductase-like Zn-dependent oxidoreductase
MEPLWLTPEGCGDDISAGYAAKRADMLAMAKDLFEVVLSGPVKIVINRTYKVREAVQAHRDLAARKTIGSTILTVSAGVPAGEFS